MAIKVFFLLLVLGTAAVVAVILAIHFRVKRHLRQASAPQAASEPPLVAVEKQTDAQGHPVTEGAASAGTAGQGRPTA